MGRIYGLETEYGLMARTRTDPDAPWRRLTADEAAQRLFAPVASQHRSTSVFTSGGGRLYLDVGSHPEYATPECTSVADLLVAERAGDDLVGALADEASAAEASAGRHTVFTVVKNNVDAWGNTYGSHENYSVSRDLDPARLTAWLVPFLVARQYLGGSGRWHRGRFTLSQRCDALADVVSAHTTRSRPLINTRDEPHADPSRFRRLHVISGDSHLVEPAAWLSLVATELVVRLAETTRTPPPGPADPIAALRAWGHDPDAAVADERGGALTCADVLHAWLDAAAHVVDDAESEAGWTAWRDTLAALGAGAPVDVEWWHKRRMLLAWQERHEAAPDDPRLGELDLRWHVLPGGGDTSRDGLGGLARRLEAAGAWVRHTDPAAVRAARERAPSASRARLRGRLLAAAQASGRDHTPDWSTFAVHDLAEPGQRRPSEVVLTLDDPFADADPAVDALIERLTHEPRVRALGSFTPPDPPASALPREGATAHESPPVTG